jgi:hypothetical protein
VTEPTSKVSPLGQNLDVTPESLEILRSLQSLQHGGPPKLRRQRICSGVLLYIGLFGILGTMIGVFYFGLSDSDSIHVLIGSSVLITGGFIGILITTVVEIADKQVLRDQIYQQYDSEIQAKAVSDANFLWGNGNYTVKEQRFRDLYQRSGDQLIQRLLKENGLLPPPKSKWLKRRHPGMR